jgi:pyrroloquinoline quinone biosynthesis protein B
MRIRVLGAAAGGGFPQWNCGCANCREVRAGSARTEARTQDGILVTADADAFVLVNASPDVLSQIRETPALSPRRPRDSPIAAIVLTNGDMDHVLGLFSLRESYPLHVYATPAVWHGLRARNVMFRTLERFDGHITWHALSLDTKTALPGGLSVAAFAVPGKLPVHLESDTAPSLEDNVGLEFSAGGARAVYCAAAARMGDYVTRFDGARAVFFDGTFFSSDELVRLGLSKARAESMAHWPIGGTSGSLTALANVNVHRKVYTHINNTNPILIRRSDERTAVEAAGWEVAYDGMEIEA